MIYVVWGEGSEFVKIGYTARKDPRGRICPGSKGGLYTIENVVLACERHNSERQDLSIEEYLAGGRPK